MVGSRGPRSLRSDLALDALEQAICARRNVDGLVHHSDRGRPAKEGLDPASKT